jgi:hypothetical protein
VTRAEVGPRPHRDDAATFPTLRECRDDDGERGELLGGGLAPEHPEEGTVGHSGMFPCFLGGSVSRLLASTRSALVTCTRVCDGRITAST